MQTKTTNQSEAQCAELEVYLDHLRRVKLQTELDINYWLRQQLEQPWDINNYTATRYKGTQREVLVRSTHA
jgi:hypothetical protein